MRALNIRVSMNTYRKIFIYVKFIFFRITDNGFSISRRSGRKGGVLRSGQGNYNEGGRFFSTVVTFKYALEILYWEFS